MLPAAVASLLPDHIVATVKATGYTGLLNGELIRRAAADGYDVLVTADRNLPAQQNVVAIGIAVVLVRGSRMADIEPQAAVFEPRWPKPGPEPSGASSPGEARLPPRSDIDDGRIVSVPCGLSGFESSRPRAEAGTTPLVAAAESRSAFARAA